MTDILQIFTGNPLSTFIGKKIEAATRPELESDDWALNIEICDIINENDDDAKDAVRAIKRRLQQSELERNFVMMNRTITVLETCVSNCSRRFHVLVTTKDFVQDLVKLIGPKNNPPIDLQERVLRLIDRWADAFRNQPDLSGVVSVYNELVAKGVTFPPRDPSSAVPIQTPQRSVPPQPQHIQGPDFRLSTDLDRIQQQTLSIIPQQGAQVNLEGDAYNKISSDLGVVQSSIEMFEELLGVLETNESDSEWNLAADLNLTCRQMQDRIVALIERVANEDLTVELLSKNDDLNNIFGKYDRLVKNRSKLTKPTSSEAPTFPLTENNAPNASSQPISTENELSLIDFNTSDEQPNPARGFAATEGTRGGDLFGGVNTSIISKPKDLQQSLLADSLKNINLDPSKPEESNLTTYKAAEKEKGALPDEISSVREQDFAEIENWLSNDSGRNLDSIANDMPSIEPISIPNSEFDNFIANRALAGLNEPSTSKKSKPSQQPDPSV